MAIPKIELDALLKEIQNLIRTSFQRLQNQYNQAISDGTSPQVAIQRLKDQVILGQGTVIQTSNIIAAETSKKMRNIYHTMQQEWSSALSAAKVNPNQYQFLSKLGKNWVTPEQAGYRVTIDGLNRKIVRFTGTRQNDATDALIGQMREQRRIDRLSQEGIQNQGKISAQTKHNVNMMWVAVFVNTCKDCRRLHGTMKTRLEWDRGKIKPGSGDTVCGHNCQCHLVPTSTMGKRLFQTDPKFTGELPDDAGIQKEFLRRSENGIKVQRARIKEMAKKRGAAYSDDYENQMLGQVQGERFNPYLQSGARTNLYLKKIPDNIVPKKFVKNVRVRK